MLSYNFLHILNPRYAKSNLNGAKVKQEGDGLIVPEANCHCMFYYSDHMVN